MNLMRFPNMWLLPTIFSAEKTLLNCRLIANEAYEQYEMTHMTDNPFAVPLIPLAGLPPFLTDTRYYHFDADVPLSLNEFCQKYYDEIRESALPDREKLRVKPAYILPNTFDFLRHIERVCPGADVRAGVKFQVKYGHQNVLFFRCAESGENLVRKIEKAFQSYRDIQTMMDIEWPTIYRDHQRSAQYIMRNVIPEAARVERVAYERPQRFDDNLYPGSLIDWRKLLKPKEAPTGAISEGHSPGKDPNDYELTGKSVSADEIDDLINRITQDIEESD